MTQPDVKPTTTYTDFELLAEVSQLLTVIDLDRVLERVIDLAKRAVGADRASVFLYSAEHRRWQRLVTMRPLNAEQSRVAVATVLDQGLAGWVLRHKRGTIVYDTEQDERWFVFPDDTIPARSAICLPLLSNDQVTALITLIHAEPNHFNEHHLRLLTIIGNQIAVAVRNAQLVNRLLEQQQQLAAILRAIPDVLLVINERGQILLLNDEASKLLDTTDSESLVGQSIRQLLAIDSAFAPLEALLNDDDTTREGTWTFDSRSDRYRQDFHVTVAPWRHPFEASGGHVIVMHDVTQMRDLNRFKSEMLKLAGHDLRSPLALIVGYSELIEMDTTDPNSPILDYLATIRRSTRRMGGLLDDLLRVEEIRSSPDELLRMTAFTDLLDMVVDSARLLAQSKQQHVIVHNDVADLPPLKLDPVLIREAMENYATNAIKYTEPGGTITLRAHADGRHLHFIVEDTGRGIAEKDVPKVFDWGYRSKRADDDTVDGKGFGLSLVKSIIERHRGDVWVESEPGVGSRFGFWLPR